MPRNRTEYDHLINDYLCVNHCIRHNGFYALSADELNIALHHLVPFERPDMYAVLSDKLVLLEHFAFDASRHSRKGMQGLQQESAISIRMEQIKPGEELFEKTDYPVSIKDWQENFNKVFSGHYAKIDAYIENVRSQVTDSANKKIITGFFIENMFPPYLNIGREIHDTPYIETLQFQQRFLSSPKLDFVLYGCYYNGKPQIFYADRESWAEIPNLIDLTDSNVTLSKLNQNEVVWGSCIEFE